MVEVQKKKTIKGLGITLPIILLILSILSTILIYSYDLYLQSENIKLEGRIKIQEENIANIKKDKNIGVYILMSENKGTLNKLEGYSQISRFINGLTYIEDNYNLILGGFNYSNGVVNTKAVTNGEVSNPYIATSNFISRYRNEKNVDFKLPFISKIEGSSDISFVLRLELKDNLINNKK